MFRFLVAAFCVAAVATACRRPNDAEQARRAAARALTGVLVYPQSSVVNVAAGEEAAELTLAARAPVTSVAAWYRRALENNGWTIKREHVVSGLTTLYAEQQGTSRPLWISIRPAVGGPGATYTLVGTLPVDSAQIR